LPGDWCLVVTGTWHCLRACSKYAEELLFDPSGSLMITNSDTIGYGVGWRWTGFQNVYEPPTLAFRINRKVSRRERHG
jgi:hypothetical protein